MRHGRRGTAEVTEKRNAVSPFKPSFGLSGKGQSTAALQPPLAHRSNAPALRSAAHTHPPSPAPKTPAAPPPGNPGRESTPAGRRPRPSPPRRPPDSRFLPPPPPRTKTTSISKSKATSTPNCYALTYFFAAGPHTARRWR